MPPGVTLKALLHGARRIDSSGDSGKDGHDAVAEVLDFNAVELSEGIAQDREVCLSQRLSLLGSHPSGEFGGANEVSKDD